jgi:hypothetical protein
MSNVIYQASDLATQRVDFLNAARSGRARLRDKDGTSLVMLPEQQLEVLEQYASWSQVHLRLSGLINSGRRLSVSELGDLAWLRVFDREDLQEFADELHSSLIAGLSDKDLRPVEETIAAWKTTARQLEDPLRRSVLLATHDEAEFEAVSAPTEDA